MKSLWVQLIYTNLVIFIVPTSFEAHFSVVTVVAIHGTKHRFNLAEPIVDISSKSQSLVEIKYSLVV